MKKYIVVLVLFLVILVGAVGCGPSDEDVTAAIEEAFQEYSELLVAGDAEAWADLATEDQVKMYPDFPAVFGKADLHASIVAFLSAADFLEFDVIVDEVEVAGDWAYARGTYTSLSEIMETGDLVPVDGKYMTIFQRQDDGTWKIHRDIFNSNVP